MQIEKQVAIWANAQCPQVSALEQFAQGRDWTVVGVISERAELRRYCETKTITTVLVWDLSQLGSDLDGLVSSIEMLRQREIELITVTEGIDSSAASGGLFFVHVAMLATSVRPALTTTFAALGDRRPADQHVVKTAEAL